MGKGERGMGNGAVGRQQAAGGRWQVAGGRWQVASGKGQVASGSPVDRTSLIAQRSLCDIPAERSSAKPSPLGRPVPYPPSFAGRSSAIDTSSCGWQIMIRSRPVSTNPPCSQPLRIRLTVYNVVPVISPKSRREI
jgi:hypothetical protein